MTRKAIFTVPVEGGRYFGVVTAISNNIACVDLGGVEGSMNVPSPSGKESPIEVGDQLHVKVVDGSVEPKLTYLRRCNDALDSSIGVTLDRSGNGICPTCNQQFSVSNANDWEFGDTGSGYHVCGQSLCILPSRSKVQDEDDKGDANGVDLLTPSPGNVEELGEILETAFPTAWERITDVWSTASRVYLSATDDPPLALALVQRLANDRSHEQTLCDLLHHKNPLVAAYAACTLFYMPTPLVYELSDRLSSRSESIIYQSLGIAVEVTLAEFGRDLVNRVT